MAVGRRPILAPCTVFRTEWFASVYRAFDSLEDFETAIAELREQTGRRAAGDGDAGVGSQEDDRGSGEAVPVPEPASAAD